MTEEKQKTIFDEIAATEDVETNVEEATQQTGEEFNLSDLDDKPVGEKYERANLDGQVVAIKKVSLTLPADAKIEASMDGQYNFKMFEFMVHYNTENKDRERYSGCKSWLDKKTGNWSKPIIGLKGKNQATKLFKAYAAFRNKEPTEVSMREFFGYLNSSPKVKLAHTAIEYSGETYHKNMIVEFVKE